MPAPRTGWTSGRPGVTTLWAEARGGPLPAGDIAAVTRARVAHNNGTGVIRVPVATQPEHLTFFEFAFPTENTSTLLRMMDVQPALPSELEDRLADLIDQVSIRDGAPPFGEVLLQAMATRPTKGRGLVGTRRGVAVAYAYALPNPDGRVWTLGVADTSSEPDRFLRLVVKILADIGVTRLVLWRPAGARAPGVGFRPVRDLLRMGTALPVTGHAVIPAGLVVRGLNAMDDLAALIQVNNRAFVDHPEQGGWTMEDLEARLSAPWFDIRGVRTGWIDDRLVGFHWTKVHTEPGPDGGGVGEVYILAVEPSFHSQGLGRILALDGLAYLYRQRRVTRVILYVDAANRAATRLYRQLSFAVEHTDRGYRLDMG